MPEMTCGNCGVDLSMVKELAVVLNYGFLSVKCPICEEFKRVFVTENQEAEYLVNG